MSNDLRTFEEQLSELAADLSAKADSWSRENEDLARYLDEAGEALSAASMIVGEMREVGSDPNEGDDDGDDDAPVCVPAGSIWRHNTDTDYYEWVAREEISAATSERLLTAGWKFAREDTYPEVDAARAALLREDATEHEREVARRTLAAAGGPPPLPDRCPDCDEVHCVCGLVESPHGRLEEG